MNKIAYIFISLLALMLHGCFTGIESTPKITYSDVKKEHIEEAPEKAFLADIKPERPAEWQTGKLFHITDGKIALVLSGVPDSVDLAGADMVYVSASPAPAVNGVQVAELAFIVADSLSVTYRTTFAYDALAAKESLEIPFAIELSVIDRIRDRIKGKRYFITTPLWYDASGDKAVHGLRHVPVDIVDVQPGNAIYPVRVVFRHADSPVDNSVYMTVGNGRAATRNFETLMAFTDPRVKYPNISPENWQLIINSQIREGMTKTECRLALGQPNVVGERPTTAGMVEYWSYTDGKYLLFEDGYLTNYRK